MAGISDLKRPLPNDLLQQLDKVRDVSNLTEGLGDLLDNERRWVHVGVLLHTIIAPSLRKYVALRLDQLWQTLTNTNHIDTQLYPNQLTRHLTSYLNYESINSNKLLGRKQQSRYNYHVKDPVDLSKLFLQTDMTQYIGFDESCNIVVLLGIIINAGICPPNAKVFAEKVRSEIRNQWVHCNLTEWDDTKYKDSANLAGQLVRSLGLSYEEENEILTQLSRWRKNDSPYDLDDYQKRWLLVGVGIQTIIAPVLRQYVAPRLDQLWQTLKNTNHIDTQLYPNQLKSHLTTLLNYEAINNNKLVERRQKNRYDYTVKDSVDLSKLFLQTQMTSYTAFDNSCDLSVLIGIIIKAGICPPSAIPIAEKVRSEVRNHWAYCDFTAWDEVKYHESFELMKNLVRSLGIANLEESVIATQLDQLKQNGNIQRINFFYLKLQ